MAVYGLFEAQTSRKHSLGLAAAKLYQSLSQSAHKKIYRKYKNPLASGLYKVYNFRVARKRRRTEYHNGAEKRLSARLRAENIKLEIK